MRRMRTKVLILGQGYVGNAMIELLRNPAIQGELHVYDPKLYPH